MKALLGAVTVIQKHGLDLLSAGIRCERSQLVEIRRQSNKLRHDHVVRAMEMLARHHKAQLPRERPGLGFSAQPAA